MSYLPGNILKPLSYEEAFNLLRSDHRLDRSYSDWRSEGAFFTAKEDIKAFKRCRNDMYSGVVVNLIIPKGAKIHIGLEHKGLNCQSPRYKCRASKAKVHSLYSFNPPHEKVDIAFGKDNFKYVAGKTVKPELFSNNQYSCAGGIHFFLDIGSVFAWGGRLSYCGKILKK